MHARAHAGRAVLHALLVRLRVGDELGERVGGEILARDQDARGIRHQADEREVGCRVVERIFVEDLVLREVGEAAEQERIAVGRGLHHAVRAGHAAGAADVLDDHLLAEHAAQAGGEDAPDRVDRAARRIGHHHGDRTRRPLLRRRRSRQREQARERPSDDCFLRMLSSLGVLAALAIYPESVPAIRGKSSISRKKSACNSQCLGKPSAPTAARRPLIRVRAKERNGPMTKNELIAAVADKAQITKTAAASAVDATFDAITGALKKGGEVKIMGFGNFKVVKRAAREGRDPRTGYAGQDQGFEAAPLLGRQGPQGGRQPLSFRFIRACPAKVATGFAKRTCSRR